MSTKFFTKGTLIQLLSRTPFTHSYGGRTFWLKQGTKGTVLHDAGNSMLNIEISGEMYAVLRDRVGPAKAVRPRIY